MLAVLLMMQLLPVSAAAENPEEIISDVYSAPVYHTVSFTAEGEEIASLFVNDGAAISRLPDAPEVEGKTFTGWFIGETAVTAETAVTQDLTVTAVYTETEAPAPENGALAEGKDYYLTGSLPDGIVEVTPATVTIAGAEVLAACDVRVSAARKLLSKSSSGEPEDGKMQLHFHNEAFSSEIVDIYRMADAEAEPEYIGTMQAEDGWVAFEADASYIYAVVRTKLTKTVTTSDGATYEIEVTYKNTAGIPMEGTDLLVSEIREGDAGYDAYISASADKLGINPENIEISRAFDISIVDEADHSIVYEPSGEVEVSIKLIGSALYEYAAVDVVHLVGDENTKSLTAYDMNSTVTGETVRFTTDSFSVYVVVGEVYLRTYRFYTLNEYGDYTEYVFETDTGAVTFTQSIKNGETPIVPGSPANPQDPTAVFAGWYESVSSAGSEPVLADEAYDFDNIPPITENEEVRLYAKFLSYVYVIFHDQQDPATGSYPIAYTERTELVNGSASVSISGKHVVYNGGKSMVFSGWADEDGNPVQTVDGKITVTDTTHLYPLFSPVFWLSFDSGPTGSGATYYPDTYYVNGVGPESLVDRIPTRDGAYTFDGWFTGADGTGAKIAKADGSLIEGASATGISVSGGKIVLTADVTLYAKWEERTTADYSIVILKQRASDEVDTSDKTYEYVESFVLSGTINQTVTVTETDYVAQFNNDSYNRLHDGAEVTDDTNPYHDYTYNAVNSTASAEVAADGSTVLYLRYDWTTKPDMSGKTFTLTFADSVTDGSSSSLPVTRTEIVYNTPLADYVLTDPISGREGYSFTGWFADKACTIRVFFKQTEYNAYTGTKVLFETMPGADLTVYAGWEEEWYVVTIDPNYGAMYAYNSQGILEGTGSTWFWSAYGTKIQEYTTVTRDYVESDSGTYYYVNHAGDGTGSSVWPDRYTYYTTNPSEATEFTTFAYEPGIYRYEGWYEVKADGSEELYDFNTIVDHNITLKLHWSKIGAFYLQYVPGEGTLNGEEELEPLYVELDGDSYADNAEVVITRSATAPDGYVFVGWTIRGDESGTVYRPGQTFTLLTSYAATVQGKETVFLEAVYTKVPTATIVYHANGAVMDVSSVDYGEPSDPSAPAPVTECDADAGTATISNLVNNSRVYLSDGSAWLSMTDAVFAGWCSNPVYDPNDESAPLLVPGTEYGVDVNEPVDLYAVWQVSVNYHLNKSTDVADFGGDWGQDYTLNDTGDIYTQNTAVGSTLTCPEKVPQYTGSESLSFLYWATKDDADNYTQHDFSQPVAGELDLYAVWGESADVPVHAVYTSDGTTFENKDVWLKETDVSVGESSITLDAVSAADYVTPTEGTYEFAYAALGNDLSKAVQKLSYNPEDGKVHITYVNGTEATLTDDEGLCFVYNNARESVTVEVHVALVDVSDGSISNQDGWRGSTTGFTLARGETKAFTAVLPDTVLVPSTHEGYAFGAIFYGTENGGTITPAGDMTVESIAFEPIVDESSVYALYLKDADENQLAELKNYNIFYLYYPELTVHYLKEADNGVLTIIEGAAVGTITYAGESLTMNDATVKQNQKVEVPSDGLIISQSVGSGNFNMPPLLDEGTNQYNLVYYKLGALAQSDNSIPVTNISELNGFISEDLTLYMDIVDNRFSWSLTGNEDDWTRISNWPVIYAIYRERGYDLTVTKTVPIDTGYQEPFTVTVSSTAINRSSYAVEGTGSNKITAEPARHDPDNPENVIPGTITFPVADGSSVKLIGLGAGSYTVTETDNENFTLTAKIGSADQSVEDNSTVTLALEAEAKLDLTNTPQYICQVGHRLFYTISDAVEWIEDNSADFSGTIEMLVDYLMPSSDAPVIPDYLDITLTSAYGTNSITRKDSFTDGAMFTNNGTFKLENIILDGDSVPASGAMIDNGGTLTIGSGATLANGANSANGGAVNSWNGAVTVAQGAVISSCSAENGGAIYASGGTVTVSGASLSGNSAVNGGAIYYAGSDSVTVSSGTISENSAAANGGALYMSTGTLSVSGGSITKNTATESGGAVYAANAAVSISGGTIGGENNGNSAANGGAVYAEAGSVTVSGGTVSYNTATANGGAICTNTAAMTMTDGSLSNNTAANGGAVYAEAGTVEVKKGSIGSNTASEYGGGIYTATGTVTLSGGNTVLSGNSAVNGAAVFTAEGSATFDGSKVQSNTALNGGAVGIGSSAARLYFKNAVTVTGNTMISGDSSVQSNVYLDQDTDAVINAIGLGGSASVGIYVAGDLTGDLFMNRGVPGAKFGTYTSTNNISKFSNDRLPGLSVQTDTAAKKVYWGKAFAVEVRYLASYANGFPPAAAGTTRYTNNNYYAPAGINASSEIAADLRSNISNMNTAVFAHAFVDGAASFDDYITDVNWNSSHDDGNSIYGAWEFIKPDGTPITGEKLIIYFAEPAYISIENNTLYPLTVSNLNVLSKSAINSTAAAGYGYVFAVDGVIRDELYPIKADDLMLEAGKSIKLLFPGGINAEYSLTGSFTGAAADILYTLTGGQNPYTLAQAAADSFSLPLAGQPDKTLNTTGGTFEIIFGGSKAICKIVTADVGTLENGEIAGRTNTPNAEGNYEYTFSTLNQAMNFVTAHMSGTKTATIEMLVDYLIPDSDVVNIPTGYDITLTTATDGIYYYKGTGNRATISRDQGNSASFITANGALVSGDYNTFLTVQNLIFDGKNFGGSNISGGIIKTKACNVEINSVDFRNCVARFGGGIYIESVDKNSGNKTPYGSLKVTNSNFTGCQSQDTGDKFGGGAIWTSMKNVVIEDSSFTNCEAVAQAGAVFHYVGGNYNATTTIAGCTFEGCQSKAAGSLESGAKTVTITGCAFRNSKATERNGGAVNVYALDNANPAVSTECSVRLENCIFENCYCVVGNNGNGNGGALRSTAVNNEVINCSFTNATGIQGGAIAISNSNANSATFTNCRMENCTATNQGGSIYCTAKTLTINGVNSITNCKATNEGGGIYHGRNVNGSSLSIEGLTIDNCSSTGKAGGGVYSTAQTSTLTNVTVRGCTTPKEGGGLCFVPGSNSGSPCSVTVTDSTISGNSAAGNGGGVYYDKSTGTLAFADSIVSGNSSGGMGGGVYTTSNLALQGTAITGNSLSHNTAGSAAGVYMTDNRKLTVGKTNPDSGYDTVTITGNTTGDGTPSDLRLPMNNTENSNSVTVLCDLEGEIRVVNASKKGTQFGSSPIAYVGGFTDLDHVFIADDDSLYGIVDRADNTHKKIIWGTEPICKITDDRGRLLFLREDEAYSPAVFNYLDRNNGSGTNEVSAFGILRAHEAGTRLYYADGTPYTGTTYQVKMLVENYTEDSMIVTPGNSKTVILTTAGSSDSLYPYRGRTGTRSTILRGSSISEMITVKSNLTMQNIVLDSGSTAGAASRILKDETANTTIILGKNATLQNAKLTGDNYGAGVRLHNGAALIIDGGSIRNCSTERSGGGIQVKNGKLTINGGSITRCEAADKGAGVYFENGSFTMTGGSITRCSAANGAGVYLADGQTMNMSGGNISGNTASSSGGGIAVGGKNSRLVFSGAPYVYGNTCETASSTDPDNPGNACNVQLDYGFNYNSDWKQADNPGTVIVSKGLIRGATVGVYVPDKDSLYINHGELGDPFATFNGSSAGVNYFYNDRNGLKGGLMDDALQPTYGNYKIYWRQIYSLEITKHVLSDTPADTLKTFNFRLTFTGEASGHIIAAEFNGEYGDLNFTGGIAEFVLHDGETKIADLLPLGFHYKVEELLSPEDAANFKTFPELVQEGDMTNELKYVYPVIFNNLHAVCKITDANEGLLYYYRDGELQPAVYSQLQNAFNALRRETFYNSEGTLVAVNTDSTKVEMLVDYALEEGTVLHAGTKAVLTTADPDAADGFPFIGSGSAAVITRGYNGTSMITVNGDLALGNITLDGSSTGFTASANGGILNVPSGGVLTVGTGSALQNSRTSGNGAGVYLAEGAVMNISGGPEFSNNVTTASLSGATNGGEAYTVPRQDIYIAGYSGTDAASLVVTGNVTSGAGSIWVWTSEQRHYEQSKQFAVMSGGTYTGLDAFRNARTDAETKNPLKSDPKYLYGIRRGSDGKVYWSGSMDLSVSKTVTGDFGDHSKEFSFTVSGLTGGETFDYTRYTSTNGTEWTEDTSGTLTADAAGKISFSLKHYQKIVISIPGGTAVTVSEENGIYTPAYSVDKGTVTPGSATPGITLDTDKEVAFTNNLNAASPTGYRANMIPYALMLATGLLLGAGMLLLPRRRRRGGG